MNNLVYYITGPDGSGKTSYLKEIITCLNNSKKKYKHIWLRSPKITSKPLMLYCRIVGLTKYKVIDGVKYGKHEFYRSKFVSWLFPILQLIDFKIKWSLIKKKLNDEILLFDRFALDTLADLMVDTSNFQLHKTRLGKSFIKLIPPQTKILVLDTDESIIRSRKIDTLFDEHLSTKINIYKILSRDLSLTVINNNKEFELVKTEVIEKSGV